jgi:hypothetical protein
MGKRTILLALMLSGQTAMAHTPVPRADPLVGSWHIAWMENRDTGGNIVRRTDRQGQLVYTPDGHMSVQVMYPQGEEQEPEGPVHYAQGGYEASWGRYDVDVRHHIVTHHVQGAMVHALVGRDASFLQLCRRTADPALDQSRRTLGCDLDTRLAPVIGGAERPLPTAPPEPAGPLPRQR